MTDLYLTKEILNGYRELCKAVLVRALDDIISDSKLESSDRESRMFDRNARYFLQSKHSDIYIEYYGCLKVKVLEEAKRRIDGKNGPSESY